MTLRPPGQYGNPGRSEAVLDLLGHEIAGEKAASLGRAGRRVEETLAALRAFGGAPQERLPLLRDATDAVYAYFIQRELCGFRRHQDVIREYGIPNEILARLGAR